MIFEARRQSFKILLLMHILVGSTLVTNCQAERNPVSTNNQSYYQKLIGTDTEDLLAALKQDRERGQQLWSDFKQFAGQQASSAKQIWTGLDLENWRQRLGGVTGSPAGQQQSATVAESGAMSATAMVVNYAANVTAVQWWQASNLTKNSFNSGHQRFAQATSKLEADVQASLLRLAESTSNIVQLANSFRVNEVIQAMTVTQNLDSTNADQSSNDSLMFTASTDEDPTADAYWLYYSDCDFWGALFEREVE